MASNVEWWNTTDSRRNETSYRKYLQNKTVERYIEYKETLSNVK
jgi:hypothetical protein